MSGEPWYNISCGGAWGVHFGRLYPVRSGVDDEVWGPNDMDGFDEFDPGQVCRLRQERETAESSSRKAEVATPPGSAPTALWGTPPSSPPRHRRLPTTRSREDFGYMSARHWSRNTMCISPHVYHPQEDETEYPRSSRSRSVEEMVHVDGHGFLTSTSKPTVRSLHARLA